MDLAEMICEKATEMHSADIEKHKLTFYVCCNTQYAVPYKFDLVEHNLIRFNNCTLAMTRTNLCAVLNQILKCYAQTYNRGISMVFLSVCNAVSEVFTTRYPERIRPCVRLPDLLRYDADMKLDSLDRVYEHIWRFVRRFRYQTVLDG
jgi:hypothetical protein